MSREILDSLGKVVHGREIVTTKRENELSKHREVFLLQQCDVRV